MQMAHVRTHEFWISLTGPQEVGILDCGSLSHQLNSKLGTLRGGKDQSAWYHEKRYLRSKTQGHTDDCHIQRPPSD